MNVPITREVKKPRLSLTTIGVFRMPLRHVERLGQRRVRGPLAADDLDQRHLVHRREEVQPDEVAPGGRRRAASSVIGSVEVFEHEQRVRLDDLHRLAEHLLLERDRLEDGLDDEVAAREVVVVGGRGDPLQQRLALLQGGPARA